jgi:3-phosphoshikimate 1-carboxyvinyltransferase
MNLIVKNSSLAGQISIPGSKSHTIRAVVIASLADGESNIHMPLVSADTLACVRACRAFGAQIEEKSENVWYVKGVGGNLKTPDDVIDVANSGTTLNFLMAVAGLIEGYTVFTGDAQTRRRPEQPMLDALNALGAYAFSTRKNGCAPLIVRGGLQGGYVEVSGVISQYLSGLLISCPLSRNDTQLSVTDLREKPYVDMTLAWLDQQNIVYEQEDHRVFRVQGNQMYRGAEMSIPADFSSATFFLCASAITNSNIVLGGLDMDDTQGDKQVIDILQKMGADIQNLPTGLRIQGNELRGTELDLSDIPDALPALAVVGCYANGKTILRNVANARFKETDRISVMCRELSKLGARISELPDGLEIEKSDLVGAEVDGHDDHRVVMALAIAGLIARGRTVIRSAEAIQVTFPNFVELMSQLGAQIVIQAENQDY